MIRTFLDNTAAAHALRALGLAAVLSSGPACGDALKDDAIARLVSAHDPAIPIAIGRVYVKQAGLEAARELLAERGRRERAGPQWGPQAPEWQQAEARLTGIVDGFIRRDVEDPAWLRAAWSSEAQRVLSAEEADEIASHFATAVGSEQREVVDLLLVGETLMATYTFTDRIRYGVRGSEPEMADLQKLWWEREPFRVRDFTDDPGSVRFATLEPGVKYCKMLAIQGIERINRHYAGVVREMHTAIEQATPLIEPYLRQFRSRTQTN